jgi:hypothetical protein
MKKTEAFDFAITALKTGKILHADFGKAVEAYNLLADSNWIQDRSKAQKLLKEFPYVINNHDEKGNYIGSVSGENGWTP